jgi:carbonic anhydrase
MGPSLNKVVIACLDARVDPAVVLGVEQGQIAVIRNVGRRVTPHTVLELVVLQEVARAAGSDIGAGRAELLGPYFETEQLAEVRVGEPKAAVAHDVAVLRAESRVAGVRVSGLVCDVETGLVTP